MDLKDIVLFVDAGSAAANQYAIALAALHGAHLTVANLTIDPSAILALSDPAVTLASPAWEETKRIAEATARSVAAMAAREGVSTSVEMAPVGAAGLVAGVAPILRRSELSVIEQPDPNFPGDRRDLINAALFDSGRPALIVPYVQQTMAVKTVLVAWDGSLHAARALADAGPWLMRADKIEIVTVLDGDDEESAVSLERVSEHLARRGLRARARTLISTGDVANSLLSHASDCGADLLVMGGYGHSRFREFVLGGATRGMLKSMTVPVLMAH